MPELIYRKGFSLKHEVAGDLEADYHSALVREIKAAGFQYRSGRLTVHLAREFGFCYGVDRAVEYAYQARRRFPDQTVFLTGEIIHNPHVNEKLRGLGIRFLSDPGSRSGRSAPAMSSSCRHSASRWACSTNCSGRAARWWTPRADRC
jgi:4-hydroxy-3-methylbut-2-en-1-yl diphosphate reductase